MYTQTIEERQNTHSGLHWGKYKQVCAVNTLPSQKRSIVIAGKR